jgi:hypothetical protein
LKTKLALILASSLFLSGCLYQKVNNYDLHRSVVFCKSPENIAEIVVFGNGYEFVVCMDGTKSELKAIKGQGK